VAQINLNVTPEFERNLRRYMRARGLRTKSEAIREAVREALGMTQRAASPAELDAWLGLAGGGRRRPRFAGEDDLWKTGDGD
jgi:Arc/MetJ-type ribon-helix-helix transcriptional regulator